MKKGRRLFLGCLIFILAGAGLGYAMRRPILSAIGNYLVVADPLEKVDAIGVLEGHVVPRCEMAAELYKRGWAPRILVTKDTPPLQEEELKRYAIYEMTAD